VPARLRPIGPILGVVPARPEKTTIGPGLGRQSGTMPDTGRHEEPIGSHSVGPLSAGPFRATAGRPVSNSILMVLILINRFKLKDLVCCYCWFGLINSLLKFRLLIPSLDFNEDKNAQATIYYQI
jgi:hypothetical protein